jgi:hypothetical protein
VLGVRKERTEAKLCSFLNKNTGNGRGQSSWHWTFHRVLHDVSQIKCEMRNRRLFAGRGGYGEAKLISLA